MATVEATTEKVQRILVDAFNDVRLRKSGGFMLEVGSTAAFVEIQAWTPDKDGNPRSLVYIWAPLGRDVKPTEELFHWAAVDGQQFRLGTVTVIENKEDGTCFLQFDHTILGDYLDPAELVTAVGGGDVHGRRPRRDRPRAVRGQALHGSARVIRDRVRDEAMRHRQGVLAPDGRAAARALGAGRSVLGPSAPTEVSLATVKVVPRTRRGRRMPRPWSPRRPRPSWRRSIDEASAKAAVRWTSARGSAGRVPRHGRRRGRSTGPSTDARRGQPRRRRPRPKRAGGRHRRDAGSDPKETTDDDPGRTRRADRPRPGQGRGPAIDRRPAAQHRTPRGRPARGQREPPRRVHRQPRHRQDDHRPDHRPAVRQHRAVVSKGHLVEVVAGRPRRGLRRPDRAQGPGRRRAGGRWRPVHRRGVLAVDGGERRVRGRGHRPAGQDDGGPSRRPGRHRRGLPRAR